MELAEFTSTSGDKAIRTRMAGWAIVDQMGHRRLLGHVDTVYLGDVALLRIVQPAFTPPPRTVAYEDWLDTHGTIPKGATIHFAPEPERVTFVTPSSLYAMEASTEGVVRAMLSNGRGVVVDRVVLADGTELARLPEPAPAAQTEDEEIPW